MRTLIKLLAIGLTCFAALTLLAADARKPHVVFVVGDHEYLSEQTMPLLAKALERHFGFRATVLQATNERGEPDRNYEKNIPGLEALEKADLAVFYLRWRQLPAEQVKHIQAYLDAGKPVLGFRTTTHAFKYPQGHPLEKWNSFGEFAFGAPPGWGAAGHTHYGHKSSTDVSIIPASADHPILKGVAPNFHARSWLYQVLPKYPLPDATPLLMGKPVEPNTPKAYDNPVAWTWQTKAGGRSVLTTLGHVEDFQLEPFQRFVVNAVHWAVGRPVPEKWPGKLALNPDP
jgi:type 1 glutamine amidotransferase